MAWLAGSSATALIFFPKLMKTSLWLGISSKLSYYWGEPEWAPLSMVHGWELVLSYAYNLTVGQYCCKFFLITKICTFPLTHFSSLLAKQQAHGWNSWRLGNYTHRPSEKLCLAYKEKKNELGELKKQLRSDNDERVHIVANDSQHDTAWS